jgi:hypothetical protein
VNRASVAFLLLLLGVALGCGKYGPPVRAGAEPPPARKPIFEVPLPVMMPEQTAPEAAPAVPELEEEPPPEGTP